MNSKSIWLVNIGEPLPTEGNKPHRMSNWKLLLEEDGYNVKYITTNFEHQRKNWINVDLNGYVALNSFISYKNNISIGRLLNHLCISLSFVFYLIKNKEKPSLIIVSYPTILLSFVAVLYGCLTRVKIFVDVRDKWPDIFEINYLVSPFLIFHKLIKFFIFKYSSFTLAVSPGYLSWATKEIKNVDFIPLSKPYIKPLDRVLDLTKEVNFIFSGSLGDTYNLDLIFKFSESFTNKKIKHKIYVCGDGPKMTSLKVMKKNNPNVILLGWLNNTDLQAQLDKAHFGLMFYNENSPQGWPNKLIEYMSNGLPIINTLNGESSDLIESYELGFNMNDLSITQNSDLIIKIIKSPEKYKRISDNNYSLFLKDFTEKKAYNKLKSIINNYV